MNFNSDDNIEFVAIFKYFSDLRPKNKNIQASLTLNQSGNLGKYSIRILNFSNYIVF